MAIPGKDVEPQQPTSRADQWAALSPYLDRALDLDDDERAAWLASLGDRDPQLAAGVRALVEEHRALNDERFLEGRADLLPDEPAAAGQQVGAYTLSSRIGQGGMGAVWLAERTDGRFERRAAIKFLNVALAGSGEARFRREGRILARLTHPHIAQLLDAGVTTGGRAYLVLEHVDGERLDRYCDRHALDVAARVRLVLQVIDAVAHAHAQLVVHRDIKPSNVLVDRGGQVKLLDFGIARLIDEQEPGEAHTILTRQGDRAFTPEFASPEQLTSGPVTTSTDVYSLGVLLYVLLTGRHPAGKSLGSPAMLVRAITEIDAARPSDAVGGKGATARALRGDLDTIVCKALKKRPADRYPSAAALGDDLRCYLADQPIAARPDGLAYRTRKFVRRNRPAVALAAAALAAIVAGGAGVLVQAHTVRVERDFAIGQLSRAEALNDLTSFLLHDAAPSGKSFTVSDLLARAERIVGRQRTDEASRVDLLISIGRQYWSQEEDRTAGRVLAEAYRRSRALSDVSIRARASCALAAALAAAGQLSRAEALYRAGVSELPSQPQFAADRVFCLLRGAEVAREAGQAGEAVARVRTARQVLNASPLESGILRLRVSADLAESYRIGGRPREASAAFGQAWALLAALGRDNTQTAGTLLNNWGLALDQLGRPLDAERVFRRAIEISSADDGGRVVSPLLLVNDARALRDLGRLGEAADRAERGCAAAERAGEEVAVNQALLLRASVYRMEGDLSRAAQMLSEVEPRLRRSLPPGHYAFAALMREQAPVAAARGDFPHAFAIADRGVALLDAAVTSGRQGREGLPALLLERCDYERALGRLGDAEKDASRVLRLAGADADPGTTSSLVGLAHLALGRVFGAEHRQAQAASAFRAAAAELRATLGTDHPDARAAATELQATTAR